MAGGGFMKGLMWGIAAYLLVQYVWPKVKGSVGMEARAYPAVGSNVTMPTIPNIPMPQPGQGGNIPGYNWAQYRQNMNQLQTCMKGCANSFSSTLPVKPVGTTF